ncbi:response regulator transcription factor [Sphingomonas carotinifaciens]|uniref:Response regulator n=1 Tax=Sphingomonas carotinifaciens TaxID=1166323 RepID=A0A1G7M3B4_9SPHN|nr:response regulator transcription factor [Sphingomonas carotinifaciens]MBB4086936.1 two-component system OmpR family response regulator [Sphingomonas carotinifaciens]MWC42130.1 response regulator [Sphingomonas carotinifaciens]SDF56247.1 two-component system, OmpR family, response regulator [Sphingomonas carotinifaciens]
MQHILLIDDDAELSHMLAEYLVPEGFNVATAVDGESGLTLALSGRFAAVVLDIMMPGMTGIETLRRIRLSSDIPVIMLTARGDHFDRIIGLEVGADDYVAKPYHPRELVARLRAVFRRVEPHRSRGQARLPELAAGQLTLASDRREASWGDTSLDLTATEFNMLAMLLAAETAVLTKDDLSLTVLGRERQPYDRSVDVHISNLRLKLKRSSRGEADIETIRGVGYRLAIAR